jgi:undecaprenyl diphosphate synthase
MDGLREKIDMGKLPSHIAIIMDGNGRWAEEKGQDRLFGHFHGVESVRDIVEGCAELGIGYLTLYAFSTENWDRPAYEVTGLMELLVETIRKESRDAEQEQYPAACHRRYDHAARICPGRIGRSAGADSPQQGPQPGHGPQLQQPLGAHGSCQEPGTGRPVRETGPHRYHAGHPAAISVHPGFPDPELMIRTSGEYRISNFLLYQLAYAELYFTSVRWPDFRKKNLYEAILDFQGRERRFGKTSAQIQQDLIAPGLYFLTNTFHKSP